jgi:hypothetical protein
MPSISRFVQQCRPDGRDAITEVAVARPAGRAPANLPRHSGGAFLETPRSEAWRNTAASAAAR